MLAVKSLIADDDAVVAVVEVAAVAHMEKVLLEPSVEDIVVAVAQGNTFVDFVATAKTAHTFYFHGQVRQQTLGSWIEGFDRSEEMGLEPYVE